MNDSGQVKVSKDVLAAPGEREPVPLIEDTNILALVNELNKGIEETVEYRPLIIEVGNSSKDVYIGEECVTTDLNEPLSERAGHGEDISIAGYTLRDESGRLEIKISPYMERIESPKGKKAWIFYEEGIIANIGIRGEHPHANVLIDAVRGILSEAYMRETVYNPVSE